MNANFIPECENPRLMFNPSAYELACQGFHPYNEKAGRFVYIEPKFSRDYYNVSMYHLLPDVDYVKRYDVYKEWFLANSDLSEMVPLYIFVPCGKCDVCIGKKTNAFVHRCKLESMAYDCLPWFVTLTYDNEHIGDNNLSVRDCQLFLKRLRINLERVGFDRKIRYVIVGEYGRNTHRAHYHAIIWNLKPTLFLSATQISDIIKSSWSYGFIQSRCVDLKNERCFYYTAKYLKKECRLPRPDAVRPFCLSSRRAGGLGAPFIDRIAGMCRRACNPTFYFLNKFTGVKEQLQFNSYVLNRIFPSYSRIVPSALRNAVREFCRDYVICEKYECGSVDIYKPYFEAIVSKFKNVIPLLYPRKMSNVAYSSDNFEANLKVINSYMDKDFSLLSQLVSLRSKFLDKLVRFFPSRDVSELAYKFRRSSSLAIAREVL